MRTIAFLMLSLCVTPLPSWSGDQKARAPSPIEVISPRNGCVAQPGESLYFLAATTLEKVGCMSIEYGDVEGGHAYCVHVSGPPYSISLDTSKLPPGPHVLHVRANLLDGRKIEAEPVEISILTNEAPTGGEAQPALSPPPVLRAGTPVRLRTAHTVASGRTTVGALVRLVVIEEVLGPRKEILVERGAQAYGTVRHTQTASWSVGSSSLGLTVDAVTAADGRLLPIRTKTEVTAYQSQDQLHLGSTRERHGSFLDEVLGGIVGDILFGPGPGASVDKGEDVAAVVADDTIVRSRRTRVTGPETNVQGEGVEVEFPGGTSVPYGRGLSLRVHPTPWEKARLVRLLMDGAEIFKGDRYGIPVRLPMKGYRTGRHELTVEVLFTDDFTVLNSTVLEVLEKTSR